MLLYEALLFEQTPPATPAESFTSRQSFPAHRQPIDTQALPRSTKNDGGISPFASQIPRTKMKPQTSPQLAQLLSRSSCHHHFPSGKRCHFPVLENSLFCARHSQPQYAPPSIPEVDLSAHFGPQSPNFSSASEINDFLASLARLMIENRISARRASVLAYIASLELRTLPAIEHELGSDLYEQMAPIVFERPHRWICPQPASHRAKIPRRRQHAHETVVLRCRGATADLLG